MQCNMLHIICIGPRSTMELILSGGDIRAKYVLNSIGLDHTTVTTLKLR